MPDLNLTPLELDIIRIALQAHQAVIAQTLQKLQTAPPPETPK